MKKVIYSFIFLFCAVLTLQAETMVVATYNLRNANGGDPRTVTVGDNAIPTSPRSYNFTGSISLVPKRANIRNCRT